MDKLLNRIERWVKRNHSDFDNEIIKHHTYNLFLTLVGFRPAFLSGKTFKAKQFGKEFNVPIKIGPYFDIPGRDYSYIVNPTYIKQFEPLFLELEKSYDDDEFVLNKRYNRRSKIIGTILGFGNCIGDSVGPTTYGITFMISPKIRMNERIEVFSYLCNKRNLQKSIKSAINIITKSKRVLSHSHLVMSFEVSYPYDKGI